MIDLDDFLNAGGGTPKDPRAKGGTSTRAPSQPKAFILADPRALPILHKEAERKHPHAFCESCPLWVSNDRQYVPSYGPTDARIAVIGEAPGRNEAARGKPFIGDSGKLLRAILRMKGIDDSGVFFTNATLCRPPGNSTPSPAALSCCGTRLAHELEQLPRLATVVPVGNTAASVVLRRQTKILTERIGPPRLSDWEPIRGKRVVPTVHPAAVLRSPSAAADLITDIGKVVNGAQGTGWHIPNYRVIDKPGSAAIALEQIRLDSEVEYIALDIETPVDKDEEYEHTAIMTCFSIAWSPRDVLVVGRNACNDRQVKQVLNRLLCDKKVILQNGKFDLQDLTANGLSGLRMHFDTMLASYCLDERSGTHGLEYLGMEYLGTPAWKRLFKERGGFTSASDEHLYEYNACDSAVTFGLKEVLEPLLEKEGQTELHAMLCRYSDLLMHIELEGVPVNAERIKELDVELSGVIADRLERCRRWVQNPSSWQQVLIALEKLGVSSPSTDKGHLGAIKECCDTDSVAPGAKFKIKFRTKRNFLELSEFIDNLTEYRRVTKLRSTYVKGMEAKARGYVGPTGISELRVHPTFKIIGTTTGRLSCAEPNVQNQPRQYGIRGIVSAPVGYRLVQVDYAGIELRVVCCLSADDSLAAVLRDPRRNVMREVASEFYGQSFDKEQYTKAKTVVHGVNYGRTKVGLSKGMSITEDEAQAHIDRYFALYPGIREWQESIKTDVFDRDVPLVTPFGRKRRFYLITPQTWEETYKEALAFKPQSIASDICLNAALRLHPQGIRLIIPVHDSLMALAPEDEAEDVARHMAAVMTQTAAEVFSDYVHFPCEAEVGISWDKLVKIEL